MERAKAKPITPRVARKPYGRSTRLGEALLGWCRNNYDRSCSLTYLLDAVDYCVSTGTVVPLWAAQPFLDRYRAWTRFQFATLDEAFGVKRPKGKHFSRRKLREQLRPLVNLHVLRRRQQGAAIGGELFSQVAKELKISEAMVGKIYYERESGLLKKVLRNASIS